MNSENEQEDFDIKPEQLKPEDAEAVVACFRSVYGDEYPIKIFYDAQSLVRANREAEYLTIVAKTATGNIVGVGNFVRSAPYRRLYEAAAGLVIKEFRNLHVNKRIWQFGYNEWAPKQRSLDAIFGETVCNHLIMQKAIDVFQFFETGLEVALMPAEAYSKERLNSGRVASLIVFRTYRPFQHEVFVPSVYKDQLVFIYSRLDDQRDFHFSEEALPSGTKTAFESKVFEFAQVARIFVQRLGADFETVLVDSENEFVDSNIKIIQVWLNLGVKSVGHAVDVCRSHGYFFGGIAPRWFNQDGILMQKVLTDPYFEGIQLYSDRGKEIFRMIREDWNRNS
ncbi:MAG: hypothetical protein M1511_04355 [Deltaproteobacteria bacterium]|nr:hypothetical protein [Deltaproteobacteria bacterium]